MRTELRRRITEAFPAGTAEPARVERALADGGRGVRRRLLTVYAAAFCVVVAITAIAVAVHLRPTPAAVEADGQVSLVLLVVSPRDVTLNLGDRLQLNVTAGYTDGSVVDVTGQVAWTSDAPVAVTVDAAGLATAAGPGTARLTAALGGVTTVAVVHVRTVAVTAVVVRPADLALRLGERSQLGVVAAFGDGSSRDVAGEVRWGSTDDSVVTVDATGLVVAVGPGRALVSATFDGASGTSTITVTG